jgi:hypothetical protein
VTATRIGLHTADRWVKISRPSPTVQAAKTATPDHRGMTAIVPAFEVTPQPVPSVSTAGLLGSALLHVLGRDEPPPAAWATFAFAGGVAYHRAWLSSAQSTAELDPLAPPAVDPTFWGAVSALARDPLAVAVAVRRLELARGAALPGWPAILRHGVAPRVSRDEQGRWFG